jgi:hypothetical protein
MAFSSLPHSRIIEISIGQNNFVMSFVEKEGRVAQSMLSV